MTKNALYLIFGLLFVSCSQTIIHEDNYPNDTTVSRTDGILKDSLSFYYPNKIQRDTQTIITGIDTFMLNWFSSALYSAQEPILYNSYLGHDIYRFLWLRSFHKPVVFSLHKDGNKVWLTTKELDKQPEFLDEYSPIKFTEPKLLSNREHDTTEIKRNVDFKSEIIKKADRKANIILNQTITLTVNEWNEFEKILINCSFGTVNPYIESSGLDGSMWTIEGHLKNKYWFVNRWSPKDNFRKAGEYLINKSGLKEEIY